VDKGTPNIDLEI